MTSVRLLGDLGGKPDSTVEKGTLKYAIGSIYDILTGGFVFPPADIVISGFPCNDFSHAGKKLGLNGSTTHNLKDDITDGNSRGTLYKSCVAVVDRMRPKMSVAENFYGLLTMKEQPIKIIMKDFSNLGYDVTYQLIKSDEHGVPQKRWRVIIMGISKERKSEVLPLHWNIIDKNKIRCNVRYYFEHLEKPDNSADIAQTLFSKEKRLDKVEGQVEIDLDCVAPYIRAEHHGNIEFRRHANGINTKKHHISQRRLTLREAGSIQTFFPEFIFNKEKDITCYKYIGNAVSP